MNLLKNAPGGRPGAVTGIRPEHLDVGDHGWEVRVDTVELLGAERLIYGRIGDEPLIVRTGQPSPNTTYRLTITPPAGSPFAKRSAAQVIFLEQYESMQSIWQYYVFRSN